MAEFQLGSISTGTLRTEDLLPIFADTLKALPWLDGIQSNSVMFSELLADADKYQSVDTEDGAEIASEVLENLTEALSAICPPFVYFGTLPGDGADFGFWPDMDSLGEAMQRMGMARGESDEERLEDDGVIVQVSDHGNVTVMDMERNVLWSVV
jgi:hypothetical protein